MDIETLIEDHRAYVRGNWGIYAETDQGNGLRLFDALEGRLRHARGCWWVKGAAWVEVTDDEAASLCRTTLTATLTAEGLKRRRWAERVASQPLRLRRAMEGLQRHLRVDDGEMPMRMGVPPLGLTAYVVTADDRRLPLVEDDRHGMDGWTWEGHAPETIRTTHVFSENGEWFSHERIPYAESRPVDHVPAVLPAMAQPSFSNRLGLHWTTRPFCNRCGLWHYYPTPETEGYGDQDKFRKCFFGQFPPAGYMTFSSVYRWALPDDVEHGHARWTLGCRCETCVAARTHWRRWRADLFHKLNAHAVPTMELQNGTPRGRWPAVGSARAVTWPSGEPVTDWHVTLCRIGAWQPF